MTSPKISIIVPVYNMEKVMCRALDSLVAQTYRDYEVILVDDGSTDGSPAICDEYAQKYPYFRVIHKCNGGLSSARNAGMAEARGEWITFCDPDDYTYPCWLENFTHNINNDVDLVCQGFDATKAEFGQNFDKFSVAVKFEGNPFSLYEILLRNNCLGYTWCKLYKGSVITQYSLRFDTSINLREDEIFILQYLFHIKKAVAVDKMGYHYFVPDWKDKYKWTIFDKERLLCKILSVVRNLDSQKNHELVRWYREELTTEYIQEFKRNKSNRRYCIKKLRSIISEYFDESQLFIVTKLVILIDPTFVLSSLVLDLHLKIKL